MVLDYHVILKDYVTKGRNNIKDTSPPHNKFGGHKHCGDEDVLILVCHMILQDHVIKGSYNYRKEPIKVSYHPAKFGCNEYCGSGHIMILLSFLILQDHVTKG